MLTVSKAVSTGSTPPTEHWPVHSPSPYTRQFGATMNSPSRRHPGVEPRHLRHHSAPKLFEVVSPPDCCCLLPQKKHMICVQNQRTGSNFVQINQRNDSTAILAYQQACDDQPMPTPRYAWLPFDIYPLHHCDDTLEPPGCSSRPWLAEASAAKATEALADSAATNTPHR